MKRHHTKTWNVILFSGAKSPIKKMKITKYTKIALFSFLLIVGAVIFHITESINNKFEQKDLQQLALYEEIEKRDLKVEAVQYEMERIQEEYRSLQEEAHEVQRSIELFKAYEEQLSELELDIPGGIDGSGGIEFSEYFDSNDDISARLMAMREELPRIIEEFEQTVSRLLEYEEELKKIPTLMPTSGGRITSRFGNRNDPFSGATSFHSGIDIAGPLNSPIYATADGIVLTAGWDGPLGRAITIQHGGTYETIYAHLNSIAVSVGDEVKKGEIIGGMGTTGRSTGVHLHYEIKRNGNYVNPYTYMTFHENK
ncbi:peptidoglycan DD-metalloendopeptidase family protein [Evansella sp. AB-rgal1]|uniref:M23 family metallopeptidase n=1 Tax=Evansella sp. AB-rgal1 TaxID=3242696 RepID=UPI00359ED282